MDTYSTGSDNNLQKVLKSWNEIFSESDKKMTFFTECNSLFSQYPFFPCPLLLCIAFSSWAWARGARKHQKHFSSRLTLSIEFFKVPCRSSLLYTPLHSTTELLSSSCSVAVSSRFFLLVCSFQYLQEVFHKLY